VEDLKGIMLDLLPGINADSDQKNVRGLELAVRLLLLIVGIVRGLDGGFLIMQIII
jgi:hypothetical protein